MFKLKFKLADIFGVPVFLDGSFAFLLLILALNVGLLALGLTLALILAVSIVAHELGHVLAAAAFGYRTRDITISLLGGCASLIALPKKAWKEFVTAIAGPAVSILLWVLGTVLLYVVPGGLFYALIDYFAYTNLLLGLFNLLPGFPMDGGRVCRSVLQLFVTREQATFAAMIVGRVFAVLLALSGLNAILAHGGFGIVRIVIAWMIWREGYREYLAVRTEERFRKWTQADFEARVSPPPYEV